MPVTLRKDTAEEIIRLALSGQDHRGVIVDIIDATFVDDTVRFFQHVVEAKFETETITFDWYREHFLDEEIDKAEFAWNSGLNLKTIGNKRGSQARQIVIDESLEHFDKFLELLESLTDDDVSVDFSITWRGVTVNLDLNETIVVINALAVRRAGRRGGTWSTLGKQVEAPLMETLCRTFDVVPRHFTRALSDDKSLREIDYYLIAPNGRRAKCEVKLMGRGNPEGADAIHARESDVLMASTLSDLAKIQLDNAGVLWTELQTPNGFLRFQHTLSALGIPHTRLDQNEDHTDRIERAIQATLYS